jgi:hypothetical protein
MLAAGEEITVIYHTPQTLRGLLGQHNGSFSLKRTDRITTQEPEEVRKFAQLQRSIKAARDK